MYTTAIKFSIGFHWAHNFNFVLQTQNFQLLRAHHCPRAFKEKKSHKASYYVSTLMRGAYAYSPSPPSPPPTNHNLTQNFKFIF